MASELVKPQYSDELNWQRAPSHVMCPRCQQSYAVYRSRLKGQKPLPVRALLNYYRCDRCECRFSSPTSVLLAAMACVLIGAAVSVGFWYW